MKINFETDPPTEEETSLAEFLKAQMRPAHPPSLLSLIRTVRILRAHGFMPEHQS